MEKTMKMIYLPNKRYYIEDKYGTQSEVANYNERIIWFPKGKNIGYCAQTDYYGKEGIWRITAAINFISEDRSTG